MAAFWVPGGLALGTLVGFPVATGPLSRRWRRLKIKAATSKKIAGKNVTILRLEFMSEKCQGRAPLVQLWISSHLRSCLSNKLNRKNPQYNFPCPEARAG